MFVKTVANSDINRLLLPGLSRKIDRQAGKQAGKMK